MTDPYQTILDTLHQEDIAYELVEHDPVHTSEEAARARNGSQDSGAKSLLLKSEVGFVVAVLQGSSRLDTKKLTKYLGVSRNPRFATPEEVEEYMRCQVGACYPLGSLVGLRTILDDPFQQQESISFNPGVHEKTITMPVEDYRRVVQPEIAPLS